MQLVTVALYDMLDHHCAAYQLDKLSLLPPLPFARGISCAGRCEWNLLLCFADFNQNGERVHKPLNALLQCMGWRDWVVVLTGPDRQTSR